MHSLTICVCVGTKLQYTVPLQSAIVTHTFLSPALSCHHDLLRWNSLNSDTKSASPLLTPTPRPSSPRPLPPPTALPPPPSLHFCSHSCFRFFGTLPVGRIPLQDLGVVAAAVVEDTASAAQPYKGFSCVA